MLPKFLQKNAEIRIISPAGAINAEYIDGATKTLSSWNLCVTEGQFARGKFGRFAGTEKERIKDLQTALDDENANAILCSRGGYGLAQIIDKIDFTAFQKQPKWLIGFSDVTVLHSTISRLDIASIHGIMAKQLTEIAENEATVKNLKEILFGKLPTYVFPPHILNRRGKARGKLVGGNFSVLYGLRATPFDIDFAGNILLIEDTGESPYKVDRMMQNLRLSGALSQISGLMVGHFSDYEEDVQMQKTMLEIIAENVKNYDFPVTFGIPAGHENENLPFILGAESEMEVNESAVKFLILNS